jgi:hypothetical protein
LSRSDILLDISQSEGIRERSVQIDIVNDSRESNSSDSSDDDDSDGLDTLGLPIHIAVPRLDFTNVLVRYDNNTVFNLYPHLLI